MGWYISLSPVNGLSPGDLPDRPVVHGRLKQTALLEQGPSDSNQQSIKKSDRTF